MRYIRHYFVSQIVQNETCTYIFDKRINTSAVTSKKSRSVGIYYVPEYTGGIFSVNTLPNLTGVFGAAAIPYTEHCGKVRYELDTGTRHFGKVRYEIIPVPENSVSSIRPQHWYPALQ